MDNLNQFELTTFQKNFYEETRCFDLCVTNFTQNTISVEEKRCLKSCLNNLTQVRKMYLNKFNDTMEHLAFVDPALRQQFEASKKSEVK